MVLEVVRAIVAKKEFPSHSGVSLKFWIFDRIEYGRGVSGWGDSVAGSICNTNCQIGVGSNNG